MKAIIGSTCCTFCEGLVWGKVHKFIFESHIWGKYRNTKGTTFKRASPNSSKLYSTISFQGWSQKITTQWWLIWAWFFWLSAISSHFIADCIWTPSLMFSFLFLLLFETSLWSYSNSLNCYQWSLSGNFFFFLLFDCAHDIQKFLGQGSHLCHRSDNIRSLTRWASGKLL